MKYLFYWCDGLSAWVPVPDKVDCIISKDDLDVGETEEVRFKVFEMAEEEFNNIPED